MTLFGCMAPFMGELNWGCLYGKFWHFSCKPQLAATQNSSQLENHDKSCPYFPATSGKCEWMLNFCRYDIIIFGCAVQIGPSVSVNLLLQRPDLLNCFGYVVGIMCLLVSCVAVWTETWHPVIAGYHLLRKIQTTVFCSIRLAQISQHANISTVSTCGRLWHDAEVGLTATGREEKTSDKINREDLDNRRHTHTCPKNCLCLKTVKTECLCGQQLVQLFSNWSAAQSSMSWIEVGA